MATDPLLAGTCLHVQPCGTLAQLSTWLLSPSLRLWAPGQEEGGQGTANAQGLCWAWHLFVSVSPGHLDSQLGPEAIGRGLLLMARGWKAGQGTRQDPHSEPSPEARGSHQAHGNHLQSGLQVGSECVGWAPPYPSSPLLHPSKSGLLSPLHPVLPLHASPAPLAGSQLSPSPAVTSPSWAMALQPSVA